MCYAQVGELADLIAPENAFPIAETNPGPCEPGATSTVTIARVMIIEATSATRFNASSS